MNCYFLLCFLAVLFLQFDSSVEATGVQDVGPKDHAIDPEFGFGGSEFGRNPNYRKKRQYGYGYPYGGYGGYGMGGYGMPMGGYGGGGLASMLGMGMMMLGR